jgi:uncharacterized protein
MKIVVFGAGGNIGSRIVKEALARGHSVVAVTRDPTRSKSPDPRVQMVKGDATDAASVASVVRGADAVVNAISPRPGSVGKAPSLVEAARGLLSVLPKSGVKRLLVVGGAGSLANASGVQLVDAPDFPAAYKREALEQREALEVYRREGGGVDWTYLSPAAVIQAGERTGKYRTGGDKLVTDAQGKSFISYEDYAVAALDELEKPRFVGKRFTAAY